MSSQEFPNGQELVSSALTPDGVAQVLQPLIAQIFGYDTTTVPASIWGSAVRVGWPPQGQPAWAESEDKAFIQVTAVDDPFAEVRDEITIPNDDVSVTQQMGFTQVWNAHVTLYGPNSYDRARLILSAFTLDWVSDSLAASNLYLLPGPSRPTYAPELFAGNWWKRADIDLQFNEQVSETLDIPSGASVEVIITTDHGLTADFTVQKPQ